MGPRLIPKHCVLRPDCERIMEDAVTKLGFSAGLTTGSSRECEQAVAQRGSRLGDFHHSPRNRLSITEVHN